MIQTEGHSCLDSQTLTDHHSEEPNDEKSFRQK